MDNDELHHAKEQDEAEDDQHYGIKNPSAINGESQSEYIRNASLRKSEHLYFGRDPKSQNVEARLARASSCSSSIIVTDTGC